MRWSIVAMSLVLVGCAASKQEMPTTRSAWGDCVSQAVAKLDDGKSDPTSIAYRVEPQCSVLYLQLTDQMVSQQITDIEGANMLQQMKSGEIQMITEAVLTRRAAQRK